MSDEKKDWMPTDEEMLAFREKLLKQGVCPPARGWEWVWMSPGHPATQLVQFVK